MEQTRHTDESGNEYWMARQLSKVLDYTDFRNFTGVIEKAWNACKNSGNDPKDHIVEANEMVTIGSGAEREMPSYQLSRYACYLIVQNADPTKEVVAIGFHSPIPASSVFISYPRPPNKQLPSDRDGGQGRKSETPIPRY